MSAEHATIKDSYIHDLATSPDAHNDGIQSIDAINVTIVHNQDLRGRYIGDISQRQHRRSARARMRWSKTICSLEEVGRCTVQPMHLPTSKFSDNAFSTKFFPKVGGFGPGNGLRRRRDPVGQRVPRDRGTHHLGVVIDRGHPGENRPSSCHDLPGERPMTSTEQSAVIIVSHNSAGWLTPCLCLHAASGNLDLDIVVVDSGSTDETVELVSASFPTFVLTTENRIRGRERR